VAETLRTSGKLSIAVAASRVLGLVREVLFAHLFGVGAIADAYQVAFRIPNLLRDLFAEGALSSAFVPTFLAALTAKDGEADDEGERRAAAYHLGNLVFAGILLVTGALSLLGIVFAEEVVGLIANDFAGGDLSPSEAADKLRLATFLTRLMMPLLTIISVSAVWMGMLNAQERYMAPAWAPAMFNVASIVTGAALVVLDPAERLGIVVWSAGTLGAGLVQALVQLPALWRLGYRPLPRLRGLARHPGVRRILRLMAPAVAGLAAIQINVFVNTRFAANLGDGGVAQLSYAFRIFHLPIGVFSVALATVTTTRVSAGAAKQDMDALRASAGEGISAVWMLMSASTVGLVVLAEPVIRLLYFSFSDAEAVAVAWVLSAYVVGLLPYGLVKILAPVFYSLDRPRIPLLASSCAVAVNIVFNALTYRELGVPGLALGTAIGAGVNIVVLRVSFARVVGRLPGVTGSQIGALVLANGVLGGVVYGAWVGVGGVIDLVGWGWGLRLVGLGCVVPLGFFVYVGVLRGLDYPGAALLWGVPGRILGRFRKPV